MILSFPVDSFTIKIDVLPRSMYNQDSRIQRTNREREPSSLKLKCFKGIKKKKKNLKLKSFKDLFYFDNNVTISGYKIKKQDDNELRGIEKRLILNLLKLNGCEISQQFSRPLLSTSKRYTNMVGGLQYRIPQHLLSCYENEYEEQFLPINSLFIYVECTTYTKKP